ncbi:VWA domain-containing protein [Cocleimonas sp. KMM 6892]|uniref:vWA domain-containing protein n=1 Tax=unclassified Cocleimonas TaxID=2639732 RepID=UPI002DBA0F88|nr:MULTISPECIES: VWA domain-containing protein [unclassified Cocleimonas]MEB8434032.1 VWA domain-containing protein [Cocleimonas sp. KMM 6892]MEC4716843.1 VWA domain-containing protein [Cocleimonas sp. KMM 6895]MEC4746002.1 VWA domain-containing protein [Cocleimonas sp. KMM 6896]
MKDKLDKLKQAFEQEPEIKASDRAKKIAMQSAMQAFEKQQNKKNENNFQGNSEHARQKDEDRKKAGLFNLLDWSKLMKYSYLFPVAAAGTLAVSVLVLNPQIFQNRERDDYLSQKTSNELNETLNSNVKSKTEVAKNIEEKTLSTVVDQNIAEPALAEAPSVKVTPVQPQHKIVQKPQDAKQVNKANPEYVGGKIGMGVTDDDATDVQFNQILSESENQSTSSGLWAGNNNKRNESSARERSAQVNHNWVSKEPTRHISSLKQPSPESDRKTVSHQASPVGNDKFEPIKTNSLKLTKYNPVSTFSIDVDTASYSFMRSSLNQGRLPQKDAVRVEELINYFPYDYEQPKDATLPFKVSTTVTPTPWNENTKLLHIGIKGYDLPKQENPKSNLVFLLDTSGSMNQENKLPLLINSFKLLLSTLQDDDTVSIVAYAGSAGQVLEPTKVKEKAKIILALERLRAGGSTAGGQGIRLAYQLAEANYDKDAVNRVLLATDGDFNVGIRDKEELKGFVERKRKSGVYLSVLGFGKGNYNDALMQKLAQNGNGNAAYIDSLSEARKVLVEEASSTLFTIAKDVKIQMEFNPKTVAEYRLIGYETRALKREDFNNDKVDAGDIGSGHTVTAIYEITPVDSENKAIDPLRYGQDIATEIKATEKKTAEDKQETKVKQSEYGFLKIRYKLPDENTSKLIQTPIHIADAVENINSASIETKFATAVAAFGQLLRDGKYTKSFSYDDVIELAQNAKGKDPYGYRAEFITLVRLAKTAQALPQ